MATIKTAIALYDGVTSPLKSMHSAMNLVLNSFESMQRASGKAIDTASIQTAREELARAGTAFDSIEESIRRAENQQDNFNNQIKQGSSAADGLWSKLKGIVATVGVMAGVKKAFGLSDTLASTTARLNLLVDDGGSIAELEQKIMASAQRSRSYYFDTAAAVASLGANAGSAFGSKDEIIAFMEQINKQFVIGGASAQGQAAAMLQLTQAMAAGALRGEELNSILENAPGIARAIESYMGVAEGSIKQYAEQGLVTAQVIKNAMFDATEETNKKFESMPKTWAQIWTSMQNKALSVFSPILKKINELANSEQISKMANKALDSLAALASVATTTLDVLVEGTALVVNNWSLLSPLIYGVATMLLLYNGYLLTHNAIQTVSNGLKTIAVIQSIAHGTAITAEMTATTGLTAAQLALNGALYACPITWIILLIVMLIALFYTAIAAVNQFAGTSVSATGTIAGAVLTMAAFIGNTAIGLLNGLISLLNMFTIPFFSIIEWIINVVNGGFDSINEAAANLIGQIIGWFMSLGKVVTTIIDSIFGTDWTSALETLRSQVTDRYKNENAITLQKEFPHIDYRFEYGSAWEVGNNFGKGMEDRISSMFDFSAVDSMSAADGLDTFQLGNTLDDIYSDTGDIAANTRETADAIDMSNEQLELLRDIAEREAINRFTTAEIRVEMNNNNTIAGTQDLDGILAELERKVEEAMVEVSEGVHI